MHALREKSVKVLILVVLVLRPGIGSLITWFDAEREGTRHGLLYSGTRSDLRGAFDKSYWQHFPPAKLICLIDVPASLFSDTVALPVTAWIEYQRSRRTDARLFGTWKSDRSRSLEEHHRIYDRYNLTQEQTEEATRGYGKRTVTFSNTEMRIELEGQTYFHRIRVVRSDTNGVVLRWRPSGNDNEFLEIEFGKDGLWLMPQSAACKEFFRKEAQPDPERARSGRGGSTID